MVDKPGRRRKETRPWGKIAAVVVIVLVGLAAGYYVYETYYNLPPPVYAELGTSQGNIYVELYPSCAPKTVANFVSLSDSGFYNDLVWHRLYPTFVIQTGDPNTRGAVNSTRYTWGEGQSNTSAPFEWCGRLHNDAGYLAMASTAAKGPGTSQFYINLANNPNLDGNYTVFGKVISGMNVVCALAAVPTYGASATQNGYSITDQPINPSEALLNNVTVIPASEAPAAQTLAACS